jgi:hypothetical protein
MTKIIQRTAYIGLLGVRDRAIRLRTSKKFDACEAHGGGFGIYRMG